MTTQTEAPNLEKNFHAAIAAMSGIVKILREDTMHAHSEIVGQALMLIIKVHSDVFHLTYDEILEKINALFLENPGKYVIQKDS